MTYNVFSGTLNLAQCTAVCFVCRAADFTLTATCIASTRWNWGKAGHADVVARRTPTAMIIGSTECRRRCSSMTST